MDTLRKIKKFRLSRDTVENDKKVCLSLLGNLLDIEDEEIVEVRAGNLRSLIECKLFYTRLAEEGLYLPAELTIEEIRDMAPNTIIHEEELGPDE